MSDEDLAQRVARFERTVATCLSVAPALFSVQCLAGALAAPTFRAMYADFGAKLPELTTFVLNTWAVWAIAAVGVPVVSMVVARTKRAGFSVVFSTVAAIAMFGVAQLVSLGLVWPIFQLGAVAQGMK